MSPADLPIKAEPAPIVQSCWQEEGVWGGGRCPELRQFVHCRNCPVYSAAAAKLLDRDLPEGYREEWAGHFSGRKEVLRLGLRSYLVFRVACEWLALPTAVLQEVAEPRLVRSVPHRRLPVLLGLVNVRGQLLPCVSLLKALHLDAIETSHGARENCSSARLLITGRGADRLAFPVEEIEGIHRFHPDDIQRPPGTVIAGKQTCMQGIATRGSRSIGVIDESLFFPRMQHWLE